MSKLVECPVCKEETFNVKTRSCKNSECGLNMDGMSERRESEYTSTEPRWEQASTEGRWSK